jgi:hypothetical protein
MKSVADALRASLRERVMAMTPDELRGPRSRAVSTSPLIARVAAVLGQSGVRYALIGAGALAAHGIARSTFDLDLFKLYAGGSQDCWDIEQLLAASDRPSLIQEVESRLEALPGQARRLWRRLSRGRRPA